MKVERKDIDKIIKGIVKDMDASRSIDEISVRNGVDAGFVEDVLQIYTTHRGIDIQGIMERLPEDLLQ